MKSFSLIAALASLACTYAADVAGTLTEGSVFEFHNSKEDFENIIPVQTNDEGCTVPQVPFKYKSMRSLVLSGEYCVFVWDRFNCGGCASDSFQLKIGKPSKGGLNVMDFDQEMGAALVSEGKCPEDNCPAANAQPLVVTSIDSADKDTIAAASAAME